MEGPSPVLHVSSSETISPRTSLVALEDLVLCCPG